MRDPNAGRPGYKETKVGWIPKEWQATAISRVAEVYLSGVDKHTREDERSVRLCNYTHVYEHDRIGPWLAFTEGTATSDETRRFCLRRNDVLVTKDSEDSGDIAKPSFVEQDMPDVVCGYHLAVLRASSQRMSGRYLSFALRAAAVRRDFQRHANGVTRYGLGLGAFSKVPVAVPPREEQAKIEQVLSAHESAVELTSELLNAKRLQKKELQEQLVTGKARLTCSQRATTVVPTRLGTMPEDWREIRLGQAFGKRTERTRRELRLMAVTMDSGLVPRQEMDRRVDSELAAVDNLVARKGDIAYNTMRMWQGAVGIATEDCHISPAYVVCSPIAGLLTWQRGGSPQWRTNA